MYQTKNSPSDVRVVPYVSVRLMTNGAIFFKNMTNHDRLFTTLKLSFSKEGWKRLR